MSRLPEAVRRGVEEALGRPGSPRRLAEVRPIAGGCINNGARLRMADDGRFFLKWNASAPPGLFDAEVDGLRALAEPDALRLPAPVARGGGSGTPSWLLMEFVEPGTRAGDFEERMGRGLAVLHRDGADGDTTFGWRRDNWIGSLDQDNTREPDWGVFWRDRRLRPQLEEARGRGFLAGSEAPVLDRVVERTPELLAGLPSHGPHLVHGDLWSGNAFADAHGGPVLVDPAVYRGHGEVDLAMTELFGGFGERFYRAYAEVLPVPAGYGSCRKPLYQLYYLLVHVNLFGSSYVARTVRAARAALGGA
jgi:fructosamine-3-kinase